MEDFERAAAIEVESAEACAGSRNVSLSEYLRKYRYTEHNSFHSIYVLHEEKQGRRWDSIEKILWKVDASDFRLERLFMPIVTLDGVEGSNPETFDDTPNISASVSPSRRTAGRCSSSRPRSGST